jgi:hypothetical protein
VGLGSTPDPYRYRLVRQLSEAKVIDLVVSTLERDEGLTPKHSEQGDLLLQPLTPILHRLAERPKLGLLPADSDTELKPAARQQAEIGRLLGDERGRQHREDQDRRPEGQPMRHCRQVREQHERVPIRQRIPGLEA